jgi:hypothetical protein
MRHGILKVRLDDQLRQLLREHLDDARVDQPDATVSSVARNLLREALASRAGNPLSTADHGYAEGFARASAAVRRAVNEALHAVAIPEEEP